MGCSGRVKQDDIRPEQKWEFISLNDFHTTSCFKPFAYGYLWVSLFISLAVYAVDTFTAVNLLVFDRWSGSIAPKIPLDISKWIFSVCIILSWINVGFEHIRAMRVIKRGAVAESYLDSLAVRLQSIRLGNGRGYKRFLVFAELTKSKKGTEYVALFTYFSFQSWIRIIFCAGPRQVINALTLYSVFQAKLVPAGGGDVGQTLLGFFQKIGILAQENHQQAIILSGMVFTLVIWVFGALSLLLAMLFYVLFLWHYIPNADGGLSSYCERKINKRLARIVSIKVNKAIEEEERKRLRADAKALKKGEKPAGRQATLPTLFDQKTDDKLPQMPMLYRNDTTTTLPVYSSRPGTPSGQPALPGFELNSLDQKRPFPARTQTGQSFGSNATLVGNASEMGYGRAASPAPSLPPLDTNGFPQAPQRTMTGLSQGSQGSQWNRGPAPPRMPSAMGDRGYTASPVSYTDSNSPPSIRPYTPQGGLGMDNFGRPLMPRGVDELDGRSNTPMGPGSAASVGRRTPFDQNMGRSSPGLGPQRVNSPPMEYGRVNSPQQNDFNRVGSPAPTNNGGYQPYNPNANSNLRSVSNASPAPGPPTSALGNYRNMTDPGPRAAPGTDYFANSPPIPRSGTVQSHGQGLGSGGSGYSSNGGNGMRSPAPGGYNGGNGNQSPAYNGQQGQYRR